MTCEICGGELEVGMPRCLYCGNKVEWPELKREPEPEEGGYTGNRRFCTRCGAPLTPGNEVCLACGHRNTPPGTYKDDAYHVGNEGYYGEASYKEHDRYEADHGNDARRYDRSDGRERRGYDDEPVYHEQRPAQQRSTSRGGMRVNPVGAAGKIVKGAASAIPTGGGGKKKKKKDDKKKTTRTVVLAVLGLMVLFGITFVIFFRLLGGSFSDASPSESPTPSETASPAATEDPNWTPTIRTERPASSSNGGGSSSGGTSNEREPSPVRTRAPQPQPTRAPQREEPTTEPEENADEETGSNEEENSSGAETGTDESGSETSSESESEVIEPE